MDKIEAYAALVVFAIITGVVGGAVFQGCAEIEKSKIVASKYN